MEVLLLPDQRPAPCLVSDQIDFLEPQLPILTEKEDRHRFLRFRSWHLKEMLRINPKLKEATWFGFVLSMDTDNILMITLFRPVRMEQHQVRRSIFQNAHGVVGHLLLRSYAPVRRSEMDILEEKIKDCLTQCKDGDIQCNLGYDISKDFRMVVFMGDKIQPSKDLGKALQCLKDYVLFAHNSDVCLVLQQGPFSLEGAFPVRDETKSFSVTRRNSEVHNSPRCDDLCNHSSKRDIETLQEPLAGLRVQSQDASTLSRGSCEVKRHGEKRTSQAATPGLPQSEAENKTDYLRHKGGERTDQDLSKYSMKQEETEKYAQVSQKPSERDEKVTPLSTGVLNSSHPQAGGEGGCALAATLHYPDQEEDDQSNRNATPCKGLPSADVAFSADSVNVKHLSISHKNPDASPSTQADLSSTSSKSNFTGKEKTLDNLQAAEAVSSCAAKDDDCGIRRKYFGSTAPVAKASTILLLGAKGSGKTCLVNAVANFIFGVKSNSEKKWTVSDETAKTGFSSTDNITGYTFGFKDQDEDVSLTLIDTPGLNDSSGHEVRDHVDSLKTFLANAAHKGLEIHCVAFVVQAHLVRLTSSERLVMDHLKTLFGQDVSDHVINLITFADYQSKPPVVEALDHYGMSTRHCFNFNNSVFCGSSEDNEKELDRAYWRTSHKSWKKCWKVVSDLSPLKTSTMKSIQKELYTTNLRDSAIQELQVEVKSFLKLCRKADCEKIDEGRRRIWDLAHVVFQTLQENERGRYTSVHALVEQEFHECNIRSDRSSKDLHVLMMGSPLAVFESVKAIIEANMELIDFTRTRTRAWHQHMDEKKGLVTSVKTFVGYSPSLQEEVSKGDEILKSIEDLVISKTYESINRTVKRHFYQLGSTFSTKSFLTLFKGQMKARYDWMFDKMFDYAESGMKNRICY